MLVVFESSEPEALVENRPWPGASTSGLAKPSYHVGPRELKADAVSSRRSAVPCTSRLPAVMADGALPGDVMPA